MTTVIIIFFRVLSTVCVEKQKTWVFVCRKIDVLNNELWKGHELN